ncbi:DUF3768 domain-containing protein [Ensifer adhaerens]|uniref:DUF3768 domain-containing protein n=1 Tax=Ensifer adhaerens TaxID=106592 RepID=UPI002100E91A|nr:DUF3768 domain-containing protein [Ensifer adhaerens]UTV37659.1 DUF3768 domain-containing protein [Ensifer adhaerens]
MTEWSKTNEHSRFNYSAWQRRVDREGLGLTYDEWVASEIVELTRQVRSLNDQLRNGLTFGRICLDGELALGTREEQSAAIKHVRQCTIFGSENDEHDFGLFTIDAQKFAWKINYYNLELNGPSLNPADPGITNRVLTIRYAEDA